MVGHRPLEAGIGVRVPDRQQVIFLLWDSIVKK